MQHFQFIILYKTEINSPRSTKNAQQVIVTGPTLWNMNNEGVCYLYVHISDLHNIRKLFSQRLSSMQTPMQIHLQ